MVGMKTTCERLITPSSLLDGNGCFCQKCAERAAHVAARRLKCSPPGVSQIGNVSLEAFTGGQRWQRDEEAGKESAGYSPIDGRI